MAKMPCRTMDCSGEAKFCECCLEQIKKKVRTDELRRISEDPSTLLFGRTLDYIRRLIAEDESGQKEVQK